MDRKAFIKSCRRNGYKYVEIAKILGLSKQRVEQILRPEKHKARILVQKYRLKPLPCQYPNCNNLKTEAHHFDYSYPLDVYWLCKKHHAEYHSKEKVIKIKKVRLCGCGKEALKYSVLRHCKDCAKKRARRMERLNYKNNPKKRALQKLLTYKWRKNNPEKWKIISRRAVKKYQETHPMAYKYRKDYYQKYRKIIRESQRRYYKNNIEKLKAQKRLYYEANKDIILLKRKEKYKLKKLST